MGKKRHWKTVLDYTSSIRSGEKRACEELKQAVGRFYGDLENPDYEMDHVGPDFCINIIESTFCHQQGEKLDGTSLRGTPFYLEPFHKFIIYNLLGFKLKDTNIVRFHEALIFIPRKNIKALALDTDIPTDNGWKKMGDIHEGDFIFGKDGELHKVIKESEIFDKPMFEVEFDDGEIIKASDDHIWRVQTKDSRKTSKYIPIGQKVRNRFNKPELRKNEGWFDATTAEMASDFKKIRKDSKGIEYKYRVPLNEPIAYSNKQLLIDPYTLGVWLGDGSSTGCTITCSDADKDEMMGYVSREGHYCRWHSHKSRTGDFSIDAKEGRGGHHKNEFLENLRTLKVYGSKHIPEIYLQASIPQRLALLQGLMDTDGTCTKSGQCLFAQKNKKLAEQLLDLVLSLGLRGTIREKKAFCGKKECGNVYEVQFWTDASFPCFRLKRKKIRLKKNLSKRMKAKSIVNIRRVANTPSKCIAIDSEDHLYLAGRKYTVTHNTSFAAALAWALALWYRKSGSKVYITSAALMQSLESFNFINYNVERMGESQKVNKKGLVHVIDNNNEHSMQANFSDGSFYIRALAASPDKQDSLNCNIAICDEIHAFKEPKQYNLFKEAMKAYTNKLLIGISTAGDNEQGFLGKRLKYCRSVLDGTIKDEQYFIFMCCANPDESGDIDFTNPIVHEMANPAYGVSIRPDELMNDARQAQNDPQQRKDFFAKSLNVYTTAIKAWFDIMEFQKSDSQYDWTLEELAALPIKWYGGADLSRMYDLTATALYGSYEGVDIAITHAFFPITQAANKADRDQIPLFGWQDDGYLTMCNGPTVNIGDVVNWFVKMRSMGFDIAIIGHDRKFAGEEYFPAMRSEGFYIEDQPQYYYLKSQGFRHIERMVKNGRFYYLHSDAYEYCVSNVSAIEKTDDMVAYRKIEDEYRIDLFDASVFACVKFLSQAEKEKQYENWWK